MKFISWNVNGLRAACGKGFADIVTELDADFFCVQETKLQAGQIDLCLPGYKSYWSYATKKGYSGVAIFSRHEPISFSEGIGSQHHDDEGRAVTLEFPSFFLVTIYAPNAQAELRRIDFRVEWEQELRRYLTRLASTKPIIICGDFNVAHHDIDLRHPERDTGGTGASMEERREFDYLLQEGFIDTYRLLHPDEEKVYTWWSYMARSRQRNDGWRIDYFLVSKSLAPLVVDASVHSHILGSDHCPISLTLNL